MTRDHESSAAAAGVRAGHLYVVATPIGNLGDLSPRAQAVLAAVDRIAAEDTRTSGSLLAHFGIRRPLVALHEHNEDRLAESLAAELAGGATLALISDAGTPLISDPGFALVRAARAAGVTVIAVPGPCAAIAALSVSGLATDAFVFAGFLPSKSAARRRAYEALLREPRTAIVYETGHRIADSLDDAIAVLGRERRCCLARELTKLHEQSHTAPLGELRDWLAADANRERGEFVLMFEGAPQAVDAQAEGLRVLAILQRELAPSAAARVAAEICGLPRKSLYAAALAGAGAAAENPDNGGPEAAESAPE